KLVTGVQTCALPIFQIAVARIVVIDQVAREAHLVEQVIVQREHPLLGKGVVCNTPLDGDRDAVELGKVLGDDEIGVDVLGEHQTRLGEIELIARNDLREMLEPGVHAARLEKSPSLKPRSHRLAKYAAPPRSTSPVSAAARTTPDAASHQGVGSIASHRTRPMAAMAAATLRANAPQPGRGR